MFITSVNSCEVNIQLLWGIYLRETLNIVEYTTVGDLRVRGSIHVTGLVLVFTPTSKKSCTSFFNERMTQCAVAIVKYLHLEKSMI